MNAKRHILPIAALLLISASTYGQSPSAEPFISKEEKVEPKSTEDIKKEKLNSASLKVEFKNGAKVTTHYDASGAIISSNAVRPKAEKLEIKEEGK